MSQIKHLLSVVFLFFLFTNLFAQTYGPELVTNGTFDSKSGWSETLGATYDVVTNSGKGTVTASSTAGNRLHQNISGLNSGSTYFVSGTYYGSLSTGSSAAVVVWNSSYTAFLGNSGQIAGSSDVDFSFTVTLDDGSLRLGLMNSGVAGETNVWDNVSIKEILPPQPVITTQPTNQSVFVGETATFSIEATGDAPLSYQWYANSIAVPGATSPSYTTDPIPDLTFDGTSVYCTVSNSGGLVESNTVSLSVSSPLGRITDGLQVLYDFQEGDGTVITDVSGVGTPINLTIHTPNSINWTTDGLEIINSPTINSITAPTRLIDACKLTNELTVEMWIRATNVVQANKTSRIITLAGNNNERNFIIAQPGTIYDIPCRTTETDENSHPGIWATDAVTTSLTHLVYTRDLTGAVTLYLDGTPFQTISVTGEFTNWDDSYILGLANEINDNGKAWLGSFYLVAMYNKALTQFEVTHNFGEGISLDVESPTIVMNPRYQGALIGESKEFRAGAVGVLPMTYQWQVDEGAGFSNIGGATKSYYRTPTVTIAENKNDYRCLITNSQGDATSNFATLYVTPNNSKVTANRQVEYKFQEGSGNVINDSGIGDPLNLVVQEPNAVEWTQFGINILSPAGIVSPAPASKIINASKGSLEFSMEAWIKPVNDTHLSRILTISSDQNTRNFTFVQNGDSYEMRSRTTTNASGSQSIESQSGTVDLSGLTHLAYTTDEFGIRKMFINGVEVKSGHNFGSISNWDSSFPLTLGSEVDDSYSWKGLVNYVALYGRALSSTEIGHNYSFGVEGGIDNINSPTGLVSNLIMASEISLTWSDNSDNESGFIIERSVGDSLTFVPIDSVAGDTNTYTDEDILESTVYFYRIKAYNVVIQSDYSNVIQVISLLNEPTNLTAQTLVFGEVILRWDENSNVEEGIAIERGEGDPIVYSILDTVEANVNSYFDDSVEELQNYTYRVSAFNSVSSSNFSNEVNITTLFADIITPTNLSIGLHSVRGIPILTWNDNSDNEAGYAIERKVAGAEYEVIDSVDADTISYTDVTVEENTVYLYRVMGYNDNTVSEFSNVADISVLTDVQNIEIPIEFGLSQNYPNPFNPSTVIKFDLPEESRVSLTIYNMLGQQVAKLVNNTFSAGRYEYIFDGSRLTSGIYIYAINAEGRDGNSFVNTKKMLLIK